MSPRTLVLATAFFALAIWGLAKACRPVMDRHRPPRARWRSLRLTLLGAGSVVIVSAPFLIWLLEWHGAAAAVTLLIGVPGVLWIGGGLAWLAEQFADTRAPSWLESNPDTTLGIPHGAVGVGLRRALCAAWALIRRARTILTARHTDVTNEDDLPSPALSRIIVGVVLFVLMIGAGVVGAVVRADREWQLSFLVYADAGLALAITATAPLLIAWCVLGVITFRPEVRRTIARVGADAGVGLVLGFLFMAVAALWSVIASSSSPAGLAESSQSASVVDWTTFIAASTAGTVVGFMVGGVRAVFSYARRFEGAPWRDSLRNELVGWLVVVVVTGVSASVSARGFQPRQILASVIDARLVNAPDLPAQAEVDVLSGAVDPAVAYRIPEFRKLVEGLMPHASAFAGFLTVLMMVFAFCAAGAKLLRGRSGLRADPPTTAGRGVPRKVVKPADGHLMIDGVADFGKPSDKEPGSRMWTCRQSIGSNGRSVLVQIDTPGLWPSDRLKELVSGILREPWRYLALTRHAVLQAIGSHALPTDTTHVHWDSIIFAFKDEPSWSLTYVLRRPDNARKRVIIEFDGARIDAVSAASWGGQDGDSRPCLPSGHSRGSTSVLLSGVRRWGCRIGFAAAAAAYLVGPASSISLPIQWTVAVVGCGALVAWLAATAASAVRARAIRRAWNEI